VKDKAMLRGLVHTAEAAIARAVDQNEPAIEVIAGLVDAARDLAEQHNPEGRLRAVDYRQLVELELPVRDKLLDPVIPAQGLAMLYAQRGRGKSYVAMRMAAAVAGGGRFGRWLAPKPASVLLVDGELPAAVVQSRLIGIAAGADDFDPEMLRIITPDLQHGSMPDLSSRAGQMLIERELGSAQLLILDNLSALVRTGVENEGESWLPVQEWALRLRQRGISVLFVHHSGKNGTQRGTSRREDLLDCVISLKPPRDYSPEEGLRCEVHFEKARSFYGPEAMPFELSMTQESNGALTWTVKDLAEAKRSQALGLRDEGMSLAKIAGVLGVSKTQAHRYVNGGGA
jgi:putative DNA primase/helicase